MFVLLMSLNALLSAAAMVPAGGILWLVVKLLDRRWAGR